jgi:hypothetical protein
MDATKKTLCRKRIHSTASDRQRAYLQRCMEGVSGAAKETSDPRQGVMRLCVLLPAMAALALTRLAKHNGTTKAALLAQ